MALTDCPMCNTSVPIEDSPSIKSCSSCGADLTRWRPKPPAPHLPMQAVVEETADSNNLALGVLGAFIRACIGVAIMFGFYKAVGFHFPLLGVTLMEFLLSLLLALAIFVAIGIATVVQLYKFKFQRTYFYHLAASLNRFPGRLRLRKLETVPRQKKERTQARIAEFEASGFVALGGFAIDELANARLLVLQQPVTRMLAVVNETPELGTWSNVFVFLANEIQPVLASNIFKPALLRFLPGEPKIHKPDASATELVKAVSSALGTN